MQLHKTLKELYVIMQSDPAIAKELPIVKVLVIRAMLWMALSECFLVIQVYPVKWFFDGIAAKDYHKVFAVCVFMAVLYKLGALIRKRMSIWRNTGQWRMWRVWWGYGHRRELRLSADWHNAHGTGEKESLVAKAIIKFEAMIDQLIFDTEPATLRITFTTVLMFFIGIPYGLLSLLTMIAYFGIMYLTERAISPLRADFQTRIKEVELFGTEITANWRAIKEMGLEEEFSDQNDELLLNFCKDEIPRHKRYLKYFMRQEDVTIYSRALLYLLIALLSMHGSTAIGNMVLATTLMERSYSNYARFAEFQSRLNEGLASLKSLVALMCLPPTVQQSENPMTPEVFEGHIRFENVSFRYPDAEVCTLKNISFEVQPFSATALVGSSGCGKSTLVALLQRMYDPTEGQVIIDDHDLKNVDYLRYRKEIIGIVSQKVQLFDRSILENIRMGRPAATDEEVYEAARLACADEFISKLTKGYQTKIGENGAKLSGGEQQRVAIARALVRNPSILILDEATSALDEESQFEVTQTIKQLIDERRMTIIIIAHRFSTIMCADQVVVIDDGQVAEIGTHEELHRRNGLYRKLRDRGNTLFE